MGNEAGVNQNRKGCQRHERRRICPRAKGMGINWNWTSVDNFGQVCDMLWLHGPRQRVHEWVKRLCFNCHLQIQVVLGRIWVEEASWRSRCPREAQGGRRWQVHWWVQHRERWDSCTNGWSLLGPTTSGRLRRIMGWPRCSSCRSPYQSYGCQQNQGEVHPWSTEIWWSLQNKILWLSWQKSCKDAKFD